MTRESGKCGGWPGSRAFRDPGSPSSITCIVCSQLKHEATVSCTLLACLVGLERWHGGRGVNDWSVQELKLGKPTTFPQS
jgi:hypothetical protein